MREGCFCRCCRRGNSPARCPFRWQVSDSMKVITAAATVVCAEKAGDAGIIRRSVAPHTWEKVCFHRVWWVTGLLHPPPILNCTVKNRDMEAQSTCGSSTSGEFLGYCVILAPLKKYLHTRRSTTRPKSSSGSVFTFTAVGEIKRLQQRGGGGRHDVMEHIWPSWRHM